MATNKERMFSDIREYLDALPTLDSEVATQELAKFSRVEKANIMQTVYISSSEYPSKYFNKKLSRLSLTLGKTVYYPVLWTPSVQELKWMKKLPKRTLVSSQEGRTYQLLG